MPKGKKVKGKVKIKKDSDVNIPWTVWALIVIVIVGIVFWLIFSNIGNYTYQGLSFSKESYGNIIVHHHSYIYKNIAGELIKYNLYLRGDPRKNNVPIMGPFEFSKRGIALGINTTGLQKCSDSTIAVAELSSFLTNNDLKIETGTPDAEQAKQYSMPIINCTTNPKNIAIIVQAGNESSVVAQSNQCFVLTAKDCEILPVVEKFIVQTRVESNQRKPN